MGIVPTGGAFEVSTSMIQVHVDAAASSPHASFTRPTPKSSSHYSSCRGITTTTYPLCVLYACKGAHA